MLNLPKVSRIECSKASDSKSPFPLSQHSNFEYYFFRTVGSYEKPTFTESEVAKFKAFNGLDEFLYQMSNATFWEKAESRPGGIDQLKTDVEKLKVSVQTHSSAHKTLLKH